LPSVDFYLKSLATVGAIVVFAFGLFQYLDSREREFKKPFNEEHLKTVVEVLGSIQSIADAKSTEDRERASAHFWMLYQGRARIFLSKSLYQSLTELPATYVAVCVDKRYTSPLYSTCDRDSASISISGFSSTAQKELATTWREPLVEVRDRPPNPMKQ